MQDRAILNMEIDMENFFQSDVPDIIDRVKGDEQRKWGMMNVQEMLEHLIFPLSFVLTEMPLVVFTPEEKLPRQQEFLASIYGLPQNFKMPLLPADKTVPLIKENLQDSKDLLKETIRQFLAVINAPDFSRKVHPVFGHLDKKGWLTFQYKHFSHHFMQFGLI